MEYCNVLLYKPMASCAGRANIKNGTGPLKDPRRRDIAPTGELAGLPARDAPKSSKNLTPLVSRARPAKSQLNGVRTGFTGPNPQRLFQFQYPYLSIRRTARPSDIADRFHDLLRDRIVDRQLDFRLGQKVDLIVGASIRL